jgi:hypothetical protein
MLRRYLIGELHERPTIQTPYEYKLTLAPDTGLVNTVTH